MDDLRNINKDLDLSGNISVITGGTSGIGEAIALSFCHTWLQDHNNR